MSINQIELIVSRLAGALIRLDSKLVTAESCTGGMLASALTSQPGSSNYFERGFITYSNSAKEELLNVSSTTLKQHGAVSAETATEMAEGALLNSQSQLAVAITGIAGPGGGSEDKPCGTVFFAWAAEGKETITTQCHFIGDREKVREQAVEFALSYTIEILNSHNS